MMYSAYKLNKLLLQGEAATQEGHEELLHVQGQEGRPWEIPLVQGKEEWLRFAGAAM